MKEKILYLVCLYLFGSAIIYGVKFLAFIASFL